MFANNKILFIAILVILLAAIGGAIAVVSRTLLGGRINMGAGGRTRQPRLGVVDAFDLDRQRQLVIVRRDNVEHLLLLGGPNDLLIETSIVRAGAAASAAPVWDKEPSPPMVTAPVTAPSSASPLPSASIALPTLPAVGDPLLPDPDKNDPSALTEPGLPIPTQEALPPRAIPVVQVPTRTPSPLPPRPTAPQPNAATRPVFPPPRPAAAPAAPRPLTTPIRPAAISASPPRTSNEVRRVEEPPQPPADERIEPETDILAPAGPREPVQAPIAPKPPATALRTARPESARPDIPAVNRPAPPPLPARPTPIAAPPPPPPAPAMKSLDALESLEEEMAKLLGRPVPPADKS